MKSFVVMTFLVLLAVIEIMSYFKCFKLVEFFELSDRISNIFFREFYYKFRYGKLKVIAGVYVLVHGLLWASMLIYSALKFEKLHQSIGLIGLVFAYLSSLRFNVYVLIVNFHLSELKNLISLKFLNRTREIRCQIDWN